MREFNPQKVFVKYRDIMSPYEPVIGRKHTITHLDETADLFVFVASNYAEDQITRIRDELRVAWEQNEKEPYLDDTPLYIHFISSNPEYDIIYNFGIIGMYK